MVNPIKAVLASAVVALAVTAIPGDAAAPVAICGLSGSASQSNCLTINADGSINASGGGAAGLMLDSTGQSILTAVQGSIPAGTAAIGSVTIGTVATAGMLNVNSAAFESSHVIKAGAGNLYGFQVTTGASGGVVQLYNATSAPVDGAVTPYRCWQVASNSTVSVSWQPIGLPMATGITIGFSTGTACFTKAASATAFIGAEYQ